MAKIQYQKIVGLSAVFRQIDLSLDRSRWTSWADLQAFFLKKKDWIQHINGFKDICLHNAIMPKKHVFRSASWLNVFTKFLLSESVLTRREMEGGLFLTESFLKLLEEKEPDKVKVELCRWSIAEYADVVLIAKLKRRDARNVIRVEHYLESELNKTLTVEYIEKHTKQDNQ